MAEANIDRLVTISVDEKFKKVEAWLERVYGGQVMQAFEVNMRTIDVLYTMMLRSTVRNTKTQLVTEDLRQKSEEYKSEAGRLNRVLSDVNLTPSSLSQSGVMSLRSLANLALLLQTKDATDTSFILAMKRLQGELNTVEEKRAVEQRSCARLLVKNRRAHSQNRQLHRALEALEKEQEYQNKQMKKDLKETRFMDAKSGDYRSNIEKQKAQLMNVGANSSLYHRTLVDQTEGLQALRRRIAPLKSRLEAYTDLPPSVPDAKVKIEEVRRQVEEIENDLIRRIDLLHM